MKTLKHIEIEMMQEWFDICIYGSSDEVPEELLFNILRSNEL